MRPSTSLYIRNMVCDRCIRVVKEELERLGLEILHVELGEAKIGTQLQVSDIETIKRVLSSNGFELLEDSNARLIESIKTAIIEYVHHNHDKEPMRLKYSEYIARKLGREYHALSALFSSVENLTIEKFIIKQRIERVKELMRYGDQTLSEIAYVMNYSSVQHLSNQFKSVTGLTPSQFKQLGPSHSHHHRVPIDRVR